MNATPHYVCPILFIHGFGGSRAEYRPIVRYLRSLGTPVCYEFSYEEKFGQVSLRIIAKQLHQFMCDRISEKEIDIIALSQGGIIARYYAHRYGDKKIRRCITICTPHAGSLLATIGILPGIKDLQSSSALLKELDTVRAEYFAIYNPLDLMVFPGWNARLECAKENKRVWALLHPLTFSSSATLKFIRSVLLPTN